MAWSGPSRPLLQFPGLVPIVGVLPACQAPGPGPREGGAAGKLARCPRGASLGRRPGAAGGGGNKGLILPVRSRWHRRGVGGSPRGTGGGRPRRGRRVTGSCFPQGAGGGNRRSSFLTLSCASGDGDQRSCCALPPLAALHRVAPLLVFSPGFQDRRPLPGTTPSPGPSAFPPLGGLRPGARVPPGPAPSRPPGTPRPSPSPALPAAQHGVSASHGATHCLGPKAGAADPRRVPHPADPGVRPLQPAALERSRCPGGERAPAR